MIKPGTKLRVALRGATATILENYENSCQDEVKVKGNRI